MYQLCDTVTSAKEKNKAVRGRGRSGLAVQGRMVEEDVTEKVTFSQRLGGGAGGSHADTRARAFPAEGTMSAASRPAPETPI